MSKHKNWKRKGTVIILQKNGKKYALDPKKPDQVFEAICRFPNTEREYYDLKPVTGVDLTKELEEWERKSSNS
jgi:hypothetical protein